MIYVKSAQWLGQGKKKNALSLIIKIVLLKKKKLQFVYNWHGAILLDLGNNMRGSYRNVIGQMENL